MLSQVLIRHLQLIVTMGGSFLLLLAGFALIAFHRRWEDGRLKVAVLSLAVLAFVGLCLCFYQYFEDDSYISLRYARNLAAGHGPVFSTDGGQPVEGYSNFLWVMAETVPYLVGLSDAAILHGIRILGLLFGAGALLLLYRLTALFTDDARGPLLAALFFAGAPFVSFWSVAGLETSMYLFWLIAGLSSAIVERRKNRTNVLSMTFFTLMALTRPEGLLLVLIVLLWDIVTHIILSQGAVRSARIRSLLPGLIVFLAVYGSYFLWRSSYYGLLLPNTFYAKTSSPDLKQIIKRAYEILPLAVYLAPLLAVTGLKYFNFAGIGRSEKGFLTFVAVCILAASFALRTGFPAFRYEVPLLPVAILFFALAVSALLFGSDGGLRLNRFAPAVRFAFLALMGMYVIYPADGLHDTKRYTENLNRAQVACGKWLRQYAPRDASLAAWDMGAIPYYSELPTILDLHPDGLLCPNTTQNGYDVDYFLSRSPSFMIMPADSLMWPDDPRHDFFRDRRFAGGYARLLSFVFAPGYILDIYGRNDVRISPEGMAEGKRLARRSAEEASIRRDRTGR